MSEDTPPVLVSSAGNAATITFNRPDRLNALDLDTVALFADAVETCVSDDQVRVISIRAAGRAFVAGGDLSYFHNASDKEAAAEAIVGRMHDALKRLTVSDKITIGCVKGPVAGGGMSLALAVDLLVAADDTVLNYAYSKIGASVDTGGSWNLPRIVGLRKALEIALFSNPIDAAEALSLGLVNIVVPAADLDAEADRWVERLANGPAIAQAQIKHLLRGAFETDFATQLDREQQSFVACAQTEDFANAVSAFLSRSKPTFSGR